jgi:hypothetical protein
MVAETPVTQNVFAKALEEIQAEDELKDSDLLALQKLVASGGCNGLEEELLSFLFSLLKMQGEELKARPIAETKTINGKKEKAIWKQTLIYIKPLFQKLASKSLEHSILEALVKVTGHLKVFFLFCFEVDLTRSGS